MRARSRLTGGAAQALVTVRSELVQTVCMGFDVQVLLVFVKPPNEHVMSALDHVFGTATHALGTKTAVVTEHVSVANEADAIAFVRSLVADALPAGAKIAEISATPA